MKRLRSILGDNTEPFLRCVLNNLKGSMINYSDLKAVGIQRAHLIDLADFDYLKNPKPFFEDGGSEYIITEKLDLLLDEYKRLNDS